MSRPTQLNPLTPPLPIFLLILFAVSSSRGQGYDDRCINDSQCDFPLICTNIGPGIPRVCRCDPAVSIEDPTIPVNATKPTCVIYADNVFDNCTVIPGFGDVEVCKKVEGSTCNGIQGVCVCIADTHFLYTDLGKRNSCIPFVELGDFCELQEQCMKIQAAECDNSRRRCTCRSGHYQSFIPCRRCVKYAVIFGDSCLEQMECDQLGPGMGCLNEVCTCDENFYSLHPDPPERCLPFLSNLKDLCVPRSQQCDRIPGAECSATSAVCACDSLHASDLAEISCLPLIQNLGQICELGTVPEHCSLIQDSLCNPGSRRCECLPGFIPLGTTACLKVADQLLDNCTVPQQCSPLGTGVVCQGGQCVCGPDYFPHQQTCHPFSSVLGDSCIPGTAQCQPIPGATCSGETQTCICNPASHTTHPDEPSCLPFLTALGERCTPAAVPDHCSQVRGAFCNAATIRCECDKDNYYQHGEECVAFTDTPFGPCTNSSQCIGIPNTICVEGNCACDDAGGFDKGLDELSCFLRPQFVDGPCEQSVNCIRLPNTDCMEQKCSCNEDFVMGSQRNACFGVLGKIGVACEETVQCLAGIGDMARCFGGFCQCSEGYLDIIDEGVTNDKCLPPSDLDGSCERDVQCTHALGEESECREAACKCNAASGHIDNRCYRRMGLNDTCAFNQECMVGVNENAACLSGICRCSPLAEEVDGLCVDAKRVGSDCRSTTECREFINGTVYCTEGKCTCSRNIRPSEDLLTCGALTLVGFTFLSALVVFFTTVNSF